MEIKNKNHTSVRSLVLLFVPPVLFGALMGINRNHVHIGMTRTFPFVAWQFYVITFFGSIATIGGILDWKYHRDVLKMKISKKEREAEMKALGLGGVSMFALMWLAMMSNQRTFYLVPILIVLIYTVVAISYDEFVFHRKRCGALENWYHRMLVFGNGIAWLAWFHFIFV